MFLSDSLPSEIRFHQAYTLSFYLLVMGRVSPVPNHTFHTYRFLYTERFFRAAFQFLHTFHGFRLYTKGSTSLCSPIRDLLTIRQNSLNVTVCMIARSSCRGYFIHSLSTLYYYNAPSLATRLTGDYRDRTFTSKCGLFLSAPVSNLPPAALHPQISYKYLPVSLIAHVFPAVQFFLFQQPQSGLHV